MYFVFFVVSNKQELTMSDFDLDFEREERIGMPEIVYGLHKSRGQIQAIAAAHAERGANLLVTRVSPDKIDGIDGHYDPVGQTFMRLEKEPELLPGTVGIVSAGTSDAPIAHEIATTLKYIGCENRSFADCGVAGLHRFLKHLDALKECDMLIVVAGFEAALTTVVAGLVPQPIIGVPTSVGYGVAEGGKTALNSMLACCVGGVTTVNIDNGVGAAMAARRMLAMKTS